MSDVTILYFTRKTEALRALGAMLDTRPNYGYKVAKATLTLCRGKGRQMFKGLWCALAHRRWHWERIAGFLHVCDECGREWRNANGRMHTRPQARTAAARDPASSPAFATSGMGPASAMTAPGALSPWQLAPVSDKQGRSQ